MLQVLSIALFEKVSLYLARNPASWNQQPLFSLSPDSSEFGDHFKGGETPGRIIATSFISTLLSSRGGKVP